MVYVTLSCTHITEKNKFQENRDALASKAETEEPKAQKTDNDEQTTQVNEPMETNECKEE